MFVHSTKPICFQFYGKNIAYKLTGQELNAFSQNKIKNLDKYETI